MATNDLDSLLRLVRLEPVFGEQMKSYTVLYDRIIKYQEDVDFWNKRRERYCKLLQLELRLKKLQTHPYNFGERIMESLQFEIEAKTKFRSLLAGLIHTELQKILDGKE